jgi:hypothetical protein
VPTVIETVRLTLWWKRSLFGGLGRYPDGITCDLSGKVSIFVCVMSGRFCRMMKMRILRNGFVKMVHLIMVFEWCC